ncbi:MAG: hypothetical protein OEM82_07635 [Acidobacteriota bacterium]|nr:hypothetical protein [Acidobacteriota bacterium]MDH3527990.1 hypothetical protein [Acidobacteriota bacterium]
MSQAKSHNKFYLFTTLSLYVGLVLVGGSAEVIARSKLTQNFQSSSFELSTRSEIVSSKLKFRKSVETSDVILHAFPGTAVYELPGRTNRLIFVEQSILARDIRFSNNQILTTNLMPRPGL